MDLLMNDISVFLLGPLFMNTIAVVKMRADDKARSIKMMPQDLDRPAYDGLTTAIVVGPIACKYKKW